MVGAFVPLFYTFLQGNFSLLLLAAMLGWYQALQRQQSWFGAACLTILTLKPQLAVFPTIMLVASQRWVWLFKSSLLIGLAIGISLLWTGLGSWFNYLTALRKIEGYYGVFGIIPETMYNLKGMLTLLLGNERGALISVINGVAYSLLLVGSIVLWRKPYNIGTAAFELRLALIILLGLLFSPHLYSHDSLLIIVPVLIVARYLRQYPQRWAGASWVAILPACIFVNEFTIGGSLRIRLLTLLMLLLAFWIGREITTTKP
jgi:hypothetical protein